MHNHHPLALAIKHEAVARVIDPLSHTNATSTLGKGVRPPSAHDVIRLGNRRQPGRDPVRPRIRPGDGPPPSTTVG
jgi:cation-transporting P-type ATPase C